MNEIAIKQGESLSLQFSFLTNGAPADVTHMVLAAQVRDASDNLVATLPLLKLGQVGVVLAQVQDTSFWPVGRLRCDIQALSGGMIVYSDTFAIHVKRSVTR